MVFFVPNFIYLTSKSLIPRSDGHYFSFSLQHRQTGKVTRTKITYSNLVSEVSRCFQTFSGTPGRGYKVSLLPSHGDRKKRDPQWKQGQDNNQ